MHAQELHVWIYVCVCVVKIELYKVSFLSCDNTPVTSWLWNNYLMYAWESVIAFMVQTIIYTSQWFRLLSILHNTIPDTGRVAFITFKTTKCTKTKCWLRSWWYKWLGGSTCNVSQKLVSTLSRKYFLISYRIICTIWISKLQILNSEFKTLQS